MVKAEKEEARGRDVVDGETGEAEIARGSKSREEVEVDSDGAPWRTGDERPDAPRADGGLAGGGRFTGSYFVSRKRAIIRFGTGEP
jgi:hypothetical protein